MEIERQILLVSDELILIFIGLLVCMLGYLIWFKQKIALIAGYKEKYIKDKKGLSQFMGKWLFTIGITTMLIPLGIRVIDYYVWWLYTFIILVAAIRIYFRTPYYYKKK
ncbi:MAG: hypothetical protein APF76_11035 [Desulfitibacter sp. BRH_c19]|nr:MAG: hypothetical protein APF76_11035 [Desulfitibacter sp. BRH_c19]